MAERIVPMLNVPDVRATIAWYAGLGFSVVSTHEDEGEMNWALVGLGSSQLMFNAGGRASADDQRDVRRDVDLYIHTDRVVDLFEQLRDRVAVRQGLHDTFYGMREFIISDLNGFWITFGQPVAPGAT